MTKSSSENREAPINKLLVFGRKAVLPGVVGFKKEKNCAQ
jgi:hypothetical protein